MLNMFSDQKLYLSSTFTVHYSTAISTHGDTGVINTIILLHPKLFSSGPLQVIGEQEGQNGAASGANCEGCVDDGTRSVPSRLWQH